MNFNVDLYTLTMNIQNNHSTRKQLVIVGAGFAGLQLGRRISSDEYDITILDIHNFHQFQPLFYQVATARIEPTSISFPLRKVFQNNKNIHVRVANVNELDTANKIIHTNEGDYRYDYLVIATGCTNNYFGNAHIEQYAYPMKSTPEAIALRNRILINFEESVTADAHQKEALMNIVVVGGGPTGVELSGALAEMKQNVLPKDFPDLNFSNLKIYLVEGSPHTLSAMSKVSQDYSQKMLEKMGIIVWTNSIVQDYDGKTVSLKDGRTIEAATLIWAAGVTGNLPAGLPKEFTVRGNRINVGLTNEVIGLPGVYAIGDIAYMVAENYPNGHPQLANVAINQAKHLAKNFNRLAEGKTMENFTYKNPGTMATIGKRKAVVDLPFASFQGRFAWLVWMFLHLMLILSVRNKLVIFINWMISYFTNDSSLRVIMLPTRKLVQIAEAQNTNVSTMK